MNYSPENYPGKAVGTFFENIVQSFSERIEKDDQDLDAQVGAAEFLTTLWCFGFYPRDRALPKARMAAETALGHQPNSGHAHAAVAVQEFADWNWQNAETGFQKALELNPDDPGILHWYALYLAALGDFDNAYHYSHRAVKLSGSTGMKVGLSAIMYFAHDFQDMVDLLVPLTIEDPNFGPAFDWLGMAYVQLERFDDSIRTYKRAVELADNTMEVVSGLGHALGMAGRREEALEVLESMQEAATQTYVPPVQMAYVHSGLSDFEGAFNQLQIAYEQGAWELSFLREEPWLECLANDVQFQELERKIGFPIRTNKN